MHKRPEHSRKVKTSTDEEVTLYWPTLKDNDGNVVLAEDIIGDLTRVNINSRYWLGECGRVGSKMLDTYNPNSLCDDWGEDLDRRHKCSMCLLATGHHRTLTKELKKMKIELIRNHQ